MLAQFGGPCGFDSLDDAVTLGAGFFGYALPTTVTEEMGTLRSSVAPLPIDADPHPGNVLCDSSGTLWMTGSAGESLDIPSLEFDMGQVLGRVEGEGFGPAAIGGAVEVMRRHDVRVPGSLTLLGRSAVTMEGTLRALSPGYRMAERAQELVADSTSTGDAREVLTREVLRSLPALRPLPQLGEDVALQLRSGRLTLRTQRYDGADRVVMDQWLDRVLWAAIGVGGLIGSAVLLLAAQLNPDAAGADYLRLIGFGGLLASSAMQMRAVARLLLRGEGERAG